MEKAFLDAIHSAKSSIDFAMYTFSRRSIYQALIDARHRGVKVRGMIDRAQFSDFPEPCVGGAACLVPEPFRSQEFVAADLDRRLALAAANPLFSKLSLAERLAVLLSGAADESGVRTAPGRDRLMHDKFVVIDGWQVLVGSGNWSNTALGVNLENLLIFDAAHRAAWVSAFQCDFDILWKGRTDPSISQQLAQCQTPEVFFTPVQTGAGNDILKVLTDAIDHAEKSILIGMHHLVLEEVFNALVRARGRGIPVSVLLDDDECMTRATPGLVQLKQAGADIRYLATNCQLFQLSHNKFALIDGQKVINGAGNWSKAGLVTNYEDFMVLTDPAITGAFGTFFSRAFELAKPRPLCGCNPREADCRERFCLGRPMH